MFCIIDMVMEMLMSSRLSQQQAFLSIISVVVASP
jgi:hypothetical protein